MLNGKQILILEKAEALFAKNGCDATTVRDIAKAGKVSPAMISYYFSSKEKLIESLFNLRMEDGKLNLEHIVKNDDISPIQKMDIIISAYVDRVFNFPEFYRVMLTEQMLNTNKTILDHIRQLKTGYANLLNQVVKEGLRQKKFLTKNKVDIVLMMSSMTGVVLQSLINKKFYRDYNELNIHSEIEIDDILKSKLNIFIKNLFKTHLHYAD